MPSVMNSLPNFNGWNKYHSRFKEVLTMTWVVIEKTPTSFREYRALPPDVPVRQKFLQERMLAAGFLSIHTESVLHQTLPCIPSAQNS